MKKRFIAFFALLVFAVGGIAGHFLAKCGLGTLPPFEQICYSTGHIVFATSGEAILVNNEPTVMRDASKDKHLFDGIENGDRVLIVHGLVMTTYPAQSSAYFLLKLPDSESINEDTLLRLEEMGWIEKNNI